MLALMLIGLIFLIGYMIGFAILYAKGKKIRRLWPTLTLCCIYSCLAILAYTDNSTSDFLPPVIVLLIGLFFYSFLIAITVILIILQIILLWPKKKKHSQL